MISINDSRGHERIFQSRERGRGGWGGGGGIGKEEVIYWLFFFFFSAGSFPKQVNRSQMRQVLAQKSSNIDNRMSTGVDD